MPTKATPDTLQQCACGSGVGFADCCEPLLSGQTTAATAEALMRSRYTAYVLGHADYLLESWHPDRRPVSLDADSHQSWLGLKILRAEHGGEQDDQGLVEFVARFKIAGRGHRLHEISRFVRADNRWFYLDGERGATDSSRKT